MNPKKFLILILKTILVNTIKYSWVQGQNLCKAFYKKGELVNTPSLYEKKNKIFFNCLRHFHGRKTDSNSSKDMQKDKASRQMCVNLKQSEGTQEEPSHSGVMTDGAKLARFTHRF